MSDVTELIEALRRGDLTLEEVAQRFRDRSWPGRGVPDARSARDLMRAEFDDPAPAQEGSFDEVYQALDRGRLSRSEFDVLARAAIEAGQ